ncbi:MAG: hypothetical protein NT002_04345 [candidate division Zixibacteria bacterium]|nr:hypothetical protein [candidate division Zixibacteria bacterium]
MENKETYKLPIKFEAIAFIILAAMSLFLRLNQLSADPPVDLSISQDVYTDPAQYTSYARNMILYGNFNPLHDFRLVFFLKSATTLLSLLVFKLGGVGYLQAKIVGLLFSFPTLILLYFIVRKVAGNVSALFYLILISIDFNQIFYGRLSFLENSMNFFATLAAALLIFGRKIWVAILAGIFLAAGIFFGKLIGLVYLFPFGCYAIYEYYHDYRPQWREFLNRYILFAVGFLAVAVFWYLFSYRPMSQSVTGYVEEQAFSLYGIPGALKSFPDFIYKYVSLGVVSRFFERMAVPALLAWGFILIFLYRAGRSDNWKQRLFGINPGMLFMMTLVLAGYGALMIWNYRPLRYQTLLIYPVYGLAGIFLANLIGAAKLEGKTRGYFWFPAVFLVFCLIPLYQLTGSFFHFSELTFIMEDEWSILLILGAVLTVAVMLLRKYFATSLFLPPQRFKNGVVLIAVMAAIVPNAVKYVKWSSLATFTTVANSKDLAQILSPEAVVSGPYAADLTQENILFNLIHMFGVANVDTTFFRRYPITHLLVDKANEGYARENYPEIFKKAVMVAHYYVGSKNVNVYRVAGLTGNITADQYQLSDFEAAMSYYLQAKSDSGHIHMKRFQSRFPDNIAANFFTGALSYEMKLYDEAERFYKRAISFCPTDFHLRYKLGDFYIKMYKITNNADYKEKGRIELEMARKLNPVSMRLSNQIDALLRGEEVLEVE